MNVITNFRISSDYNTADNADENDIRNKRQSKRKLTNEPPRMRQAERKTSEKILLDAMQLASYKTSSQSYSKNTQIFAKNTKNLEKIPFEKFHTEFDTLLDAENVAHSKVQLKDHDNEYTNQQLTDLDPLPAHEDERPFNLADINNKFLEIESSLTGSQRRTEPNALIESLKKLATQLTAKEGEKISAEEFDLNLDNMQCSVDFIEGYCEASSFNDDLKEKISFELNVVKDLLDQIAAVNSPTGLPAAIVEARAVQFIKDSTKSSFASSTANRINSSVLNKDREKRQDDTLPLATLRSI